MIKPLETLLCQLVAQSVPPEDSASLLCQLTQDDWQELLALAERHGLLPMLYARVFRSGCAGDVPDLCFEKLHRASLLNATRSMIYLDEAGKIISALSEASIPVIALKGVYLLENIYQDVSLRTMSDLDFMLRRSDIPAAIQVMRDLGYELTTYFDPAAENLDIKHVPPLKKDNGPFVELHWTLLEENEPFIIDAEGLWQRAVPSDVAEHLVLALSPEDLLLHLCLHMAYQHHLAVGLRQVIDIDRVLLHFKDALNWDQLLCTAKQWGAERVLWLSLSLARQLVHARFPDLLLEKLHAGQVDPWVLQQASRQMFQEDDVASVTPDLARFAQSNNLLSRLKVLSKRVFLPKPVIARLYNISPGSLCIYACYIKRLIDLMRGYSGSARRILQQDADTMQAVKHAQAAHKLTAWMQGSDT